MKTPWQLDIHYYCWAFASVPRVRPHLAAHAAYCTATYRVWDEGSLSLASFEREAETLFVICLVKGYASTEFHM